MEATTGQSVTVPAACVRLLLYQRARYRCKAYQALRRLPYAKPLYLRYLSYFEILRRRRIERLYTADIDAALATFEAWIPRRPERILDIGAGMAGIDAALYQRYGHEGLELWLLDRQGVSGHHTGGFNASVERFSHYNSFEQARALLAANGVPEAHVHQVEVSEDGFPKGEQFDVIVSLLAWGFHFSVNTYLDPAYTALRDGGCLVLDVRRGTSGGELLDSKFGGDVHVVHETPKLKRLIARK